MLGEKRIELTGADIIVPPGLPLALDHDHIEETRAIGFEVE